METSLLSGYLLRLPLFLVWLAGVAIALRQRRQHPENSQVILIALMTLITANVIDLYISPQLPIFAREQGLGAQGYGLVALIKGIILTVVTAAAWGLVLRAAWRSDKTTLQPGSDH